MAALFTIAGSVGATEFDCMIEPQQIVEIRSPVVGLIETVHAHRGDLVRKGQLLVTIDSKVEQSAAQAAHYKSEALGALHASEAKLEAATIKAKRNQALFDEEFVSQQARDDAEGERRTAEAEVQAAKETLEVSRLEYQESSAQVQRRELHSPFAGVVMDQYQYAGAIVDSGEGKKPILKIAETNILRVESILPFSLYQKLKVGAGATIKPEAPLTGSYKGKIKVVDSVIDSASGTFGVAIDLPNPGHSIPAGVRCKVNFTSIE